MQIRDIYIVDRLVRVYDVDGSYIEYGADDMLDLGAWVLQRKERLLEIVRQQIKAHQTEKHVEERNL